MYKKGDIQATDPWCRDTGEDGYCDYEHRHVVSDARSDGVKVTYSRGQFYLPHSCGEWVIGGPIEVLQMIEGLKEALAEYDKRPVFTYVQILKSEENNI